MTARRNKVLLLLLAAVCLCCLLCGISFFGGNTTAYAYSSSVRYKLDVTATGAEGIYLYVNGASGSGTITDGAALNYAPNRVDVVLNKRTKLGRFYYTKYVEDFELSGPTTYSKADKTRNSSRTSTKTVTYTLPSLSDGKYTLKVTTGSDYSGVVGDASSKITFTFYVDRNAPTISGASTSATGKYATSSFTVRASDSVSGVESLYMKAPNSSYYSSVGSSSKTISSGSANGLYSFYAYDKAQNKSKTYYVYFDSTKPVGTLKTSIGAVSSGSYTNQSFSYTASDSGSGIKTLQYKTPGSSTWKTYTSGTTISSTSTNGWYYFRAQDKSGLYSDESKICLDTGKPAGTLYGGTKAAASGSTVTSQYVKFTAADGLSGISKVYVKKPVRWDMPLYQTAVNSRRTGRILFTARTWRATAPMTIRSHLIILLPNLFAKVRNSARLPNRVSPLRREMPEERQRCTIAMNTANGRRAATVARFRINSRTDDIIFTPWTSKIINLRNCGCCSMPPNLREDSCNRTSITAFTLRGTAIIGQQRWTEKHITRGHGSATRATIRLYCPTAWVRAQRITSQSTTITL